MLLFIKRTTYVLTTLCLLTIACFDTIDYKKIEPTFFYKKTLDNIKKSPEATPKSSPLQIGWSKKTIVPVLPFKLAGYGVNSKKYTGIRDSIYVRTIVVSSNNKKYAIISYDLLIVNPSIVESIKASSAFKTLQLDGLYFSATHSHQSISGWDKSVVGKFAVGGYDKSIVEMIASQTVKSLTHSVHTLSEGRIAYSEASGANFVSNKFKGSYVDNTIRSILFTKTDSTSALLTSFSAHATTTPSSSSLLSGDYPNYLIKELENNATIDFALFCAGGVSNHSAKIKSDEKTMENVNTYGKKLAHLILEKLPEAKPDTDSIPLSFKKHPVFLPDPVLKLTKNIRTRSWLFNSLFNRKSETYVSHLRLGSIDLVATPCDFSGELRPKINTTNPLLITSFNGDYIGYVIVDKHYHERTREAQETNWYGPYTGSYFSAIINSIIKK